MNTPFKNILESEFKTQFSTEEACLLYLANQKWKLGFICKKCGHTNYCKGKIIHSRRCTTCKHDESPKVGTMFEGCRFSLPKAFYISYIVCNATNISSYELSKKLDLRQMTCWSFKKKLQECVQNNPKISQQQKIEIDKILLK